MNNVIIDGLSFALPLFIMAIGGIYSERSGVTNLALEGLQGFGAFTGALVAYMLMQFTSVDSSARLLCGTFVCHDRRYDFFFASCLALCTLQGEPGDQRCCDQHSGHGAYCIPYKGDQPICIWDTF